MSKFIPVCVVTIALLVALAGYAFAVGLMDYFSKVEGSKAVVLQWEDMGPTPEADKKYVPQGMTIDGDTMFLAISFDDEITRVFAIDTQNMKIMKYFDMPPEAVHTSGLSVDGPFLWAVDNISNKCYKISIEKSLLSGKAVVVGLFDTGFDGTSACTVVPVADRKLLAISDFMNSRKTIFVDPDIAIRDGNVDSAKLHEYKNEGFSQGLTWKAPYLLESENKFGVDIINVIDVDKAIKTKDVLKSTVMQINAPHEGVEDLGLDGQYLWTSDEISYRISRSPLAALDTKIKALSYEN